MIFFEHLSVKALVPLLEPQMDQPAWPGLIDPAVRDRARAYLLETGRWERLGREFDSRRPIASLKRSLYRDYQRTGNRIPFEKEYKALLTELESAVLAVWLDHPAAELDHVQDLIWAFCEMTTWNIPCHEGGLTMELVSTRVGRRLAEYGFLLSGRLEDEVKTRIDHELERRMLSPALDPARADWWQTCENNWNHVCNANLIAIALYQIKDVRHLAFFLHAIVLRLGYAIDGFTDDGGCVEGPMYWDYGFSHFVDAAIMLHHRTGGAVNLMTADPKIERICRYPLAAYLRPPLRATFADSGNGWIGAGTVLKINRFFPLPALLSFAGRTGDGGHLLLDEITTFAIYNGERPQAYQDRADYLLPDLGLVKAHAADFSSEVVLAVSAGSNDVSHNHNDLGGFIICKHDTVLFTDPGSPIYSSKTFGPKRYELLFCRSRGHSVPLVNGHEQSAGPEFRASLSVENLNQPDAVKTVTADLTHAYADPTLSSLVRRWNLLPEGTIKISDTFLFTESPTAVEEGFVTFAPVELLSDSRAVRVGEGNAGSILRAESAGRFDLERFPPEVHEGQDPRPFHRLRFIPDVLAQEMTLAFTLG